MGKSETDINNRARTLTDPIRNFRFIVSFYPTVYGNPNSDKTNFRSHWQPVGRFGFTSVSGFAFNVSPFEIAEGGYNATVHQIPLRVKFSALQLDRGIYLGTRQNWDWMKIMLGVVQGKGNPSTSVLYRADVEIAVLMHPVPYSHMGTGYGGKGSSYSRAKDDRVAMRFRIYNAWPTSVVYSDLNAGDNALMVERMTLVHEGLDLEWGDAANGKITDAGTFGR